MRTLDELYAAMRLAAGENRGADYEALKEQARSERQRQAALMDLRANLTIREREAFGTRDWNRAHERVSEIQRELHTEALAGQPF